MRQWNIFKYYNFEYSHVSHLVNLYDNSRVALCTLTLITIIQLDMVVDSGGTTLYVLVGNGKLHSLFKKCLKQFYSKVCVFWQQLFIIYFRLLELLF